MCRKKSPRTWMCCPSFSSSGGMSWTWWPAIFGCDLRSSARIEVPLRCRPTTKTWRGSVVGDAAFGMKLFGIADLFSSSFSDLDFWTSDWSASCRGVGHDQRGRGGRRRPSPTAPRARARGGAIGLHAKGAGSRCGRGGVAQMGHGRRSWPSANGCITRGSRYQESRFFRAQITHRASYQRGSECRVAFSITHTAGDELSGELANVEFGLRVSLGQPLVLVEKKGALVPLLPWVEGGPPWGTWRRTQ